MRKRGNGLRVWEFRYYDLLPDGTRPSRAVTVGTLEDYPSEAAARKSPAVQAIVLRINAEHPLGPVTASTVGALIARYEQEEMPTRHSTRISYQSFIDQHIRPRWSDTSISSVKPMLVEDWLKRLDLAPKTKIHIRSLLRTIFECAQRWELWPMSSCNPISLVRVKGGSKRQKTIRVLTIEEFNNLLSHIREPYRTMVLVAGCLGLRVSEIVGLKWSDFDFDDLTVLVQRSIVHGQVGEVKTEYSKDRIPLDPLLVEALLKHRDRSTPTAEGWLFASPVTQRPYHQEEIQKRHLRRGAKAAGIGSNIGWHTFRHSYRSWLDDSGAPMSVQKELMRHASIQTTMNVYGKAMTDTKRQAHSKIVQMVLKPEPSAKAVDNGKPSHLANVG